MKPLVGPCGKTDSQKPKFPNNFMRYLLFLPLVALAGCLAGTWVHGPPLQRIEYVYTQGGHLIMAIYTLEGHTYLYHGDKDGSIKPIACLLPGKHVRPDSATFFYYYGLLQAYLRVYHGTVPGHRI